MCEVYVDALSDFRNNSVTFSLTLFSLQTKYVYIKSTTVYVPSSELGLSQSHPLSRQQVWPSPRNQPKGGTHSPSGKGFGVSQFRRLKKKLSTPPTLWMVCKCRWLQLLFKEGALLVEIGHLSEEDLRGTTAWNVKGMDQISIKTPNPKCRLFFKNDQ